MIYAFNVTFFIYYINLILNKKQLNKTFLLNITRNTGDAYRYHGSAMMYEFPFSFRKVGGNIHMIAENVKFRAEKDSAIFKAITAGKQVALLAPTTVLAQQHWRTISERFAPYPIKVSLLNRFRSASES